MSLALAAISTDQMDTIELMRDIDERYQALSKLKMRNMYSIFYSRIDPAPVIVIGINPGGNPQTWTTDRLASSGFYENWEHEYVDCKYAIQEPMLPLLKSVLSTDDDGIRKVPKINLAFRRSQGTDDFKIIHGMTLTAGQNEAKPFVEEIIRHTNPNVVLLEGMTTYEAFKRKYCERGSIEIVDESVFAMHRGKKVRIYEASRATISCTNNHSVLLGIGHPSSFGSKPEFTNVIPRLREMVDRYI